MAQTIGGVYGLVRVEFAGTRASSSYQSEISAATGSYAYEDDNSGTTFTVAKGAAAPPHAVTGRTGFSAKAVLDDVQADRESTGEAEEVPADD